MLANEICESLHYLFIYMLHSILTFPDSLGCNTGRLFYNHTLSCIQPMDWTDVPDMNSSLSRLQGENEEVSAMMRVLVGAEMLQSNRNPGHMEFSVPSLSAVSSSLWMFPTVADAQLAATDATMTFEPSEPSEPQSTLHHVSIYEEILLLP